MKIRIITSGKDWSIENTGKGKFAKRLANEFVKQGEKVVTTNDPVDIDLQIGRFHYLSVNYKKIVLRLGPAHINSRSWYYKYNKWKMSSLIKSDAVVYQGEFSRKICNAFIGKVEMPYRIIRNGDDPEYYRDIAPYPSQYKINFLASTRRWIPQKRLNVIVKAFLNAGIPDSHLWVAGDPEKNEKVNDDRITYLGLIDSQMLAGLYKLCVAMIHIVYLDACPNSVAECLVAGCPVICTNQGGTHELVCKNGIILNDKKYNFKPIDLKYPPEIKINVISQAMRDIISFGQVTADYLYIETIAKQYRQFFNEIL